MPRPPGIIDRVNFITRMWSNPCRLPWVVYVETALPAALEIAIAVLCFDLLDVIRWLFSPARARRGGHIAGRRNRKRGRQRQGLRRRLTRKFPPFAALQSRKVTQGVKNLWIVDGIGQRLLWWWLVADLGTGFFYNWTSLIYKTERCQMATAPGAGLREAATQFYLAIQGWHAANYGVPQYQDGNVTMATFAQHHGAGEFETVMSLQVTNTFTVTNITTIRIRFSGIQGDSVATSEPLALAPGASGGLVVTLQTFNTGDIFPEVLVSTGNVQGTAGAIYIQGQPVEIPPPIKFKCPIPFVGSP